MIPFEELSRNDRILVVCAIGAATIAAFHFGLFKLPALWQSLRERCRSLGLVNLRRALDHPPTRPMWLDEELEAVRREQLEAAVILPFRRHQ